MQNHYIYKMINISKTLVKNYFFLISMEQPFVKKQEKSFASAFITNIYIFSFININSEKIRLKISKTVYAYLRAQ